MKLQLGDAQHSIMRNQQLGDVIEESHDGGRHTLIFTVQGAEGLLPHPSIQALAPDNAIDIIVPPADAESALQAAAADEQPDFQGKIEPLLMTDVDDHGHCRSPAATRNQKQQQSVFSPPLPPTPMPQQPARQDRPKQQEAEQDYQVRMPAQVGLACFPACRLHDTSGVGMGKEIADRGMKSGICFHLLFSLMIFALCRVSDSPCKGAQPAAIGVTG